jgi:hypothetical protein
LISTKFGEYFTSGVYFSSPFFGPIDSLIGLSNVNTDYLNSVVRSYSDKSLIREDNRVRGMRFKEWIGGKVGY